MTPWRRTFLPLLLLALPLWSGPAPAAGSMSGRKQAAIRELLQLTGSARLGVQVMNNLMPALKAASSQDPAFKGLNDEFWATFQSKVDPNELIDRVIPIYEAHFSLEDIQALIQFYRTPLGQKVVTEMPAVLNECMAAGQAWGREVAARALAEMRARRGASHP